MFHSSTHRAVRPFRWWSAVSLAIVYMLIVMSPLASLAMHSKAVAHAVTGECSGDCDICGCSLESRSNHTCCCAKMKQQQANVTGIVSGLCCSPKVAAVDQKKECCSKSSSLHREVADQSGPHVMKSAGQHVDHETAPVQKADSTKTETVYKCGCPCGKDKMLSLTGFGSNELLPITSSEKIQPLHVETVFSDLLNRLASRHGEPPDPPPRLPLLS
jgi:hypothetical protein